MLSKPINPNTIFQNHRKNVVIQNSDYKDFTIVEYKNNSTGLSKLKIPELKHICKHNRLHISGTKPVLIDRIHEFFKKYAFAIKLQKMIRGYYVRSSFKLRGVAFKNRAICTNTTDFYTMEPLEEISHYKFYSYTDAQNFTYGFDIDSLIELFKKKGRIINPYNREKITMQTMNDILKLYRLVEIIYKEDDIIDEMPITIEPINNIVTTMQNPLIQQLSPIMPISVSEQVGQTNIVTRMTEHQLSVIRDKPLTDRITSVFMDIDQLGHYTDVSWFNDLDKRQCFQFYREIINIWRFRAQIPYMTKFRICPYDPVSNIFPLLNFDTITMDTLKEGCLRVIENMVYMGYDTDHRNLGAYHILTAFTVVSIPARTQMPWLYESIY